MNRQNDKENPEYLLSQYIDGQLTRDQEENLSDRLATDEELRDQLRLYTSLNARLDLDSDELDKIDYDGQRAAIVAAVERKILLEGLPRRRRILRPVFGALAAAALVLLVVSAGVLMFRKQTVPVAGPVISVMMLPETSAADSAGTMSVQMRRLDSAELVAMVEPARATIPSGTVVVLIGSPVERVASAFPAEMFWIE